MWRQGPLDDPPQATNTLPKDRNRTVSAVYAVEVTLRLGSLMRQLLASPLAATVVETSDGRCLIRRGTSITRSTYPTRSTNCAKRPPANPRLAAALLRVLRMLTVHVAMWGHRTWCRRWSDRRQCYWTLLPTPACIHRIWPGWVRSRPEETQQTTGQGQNRHHLQVDDGPNFLVNFMCKDT